MGGQVISLLWKDLSDGCGETNCDSMQNGGITFMFINKETFSFSATFFPNIWLLSQLLISTEMLCSLELRGMWSLCHSQQSSECCGLYTAHFI